MKKTIRFIIILLGFSTHLYANNPAVKITSFNPSIGCIGYEVTIIGTGFGDVQGTGSVYFNRRKTASIIKEWTDSKIRVEIPEGTITGGIRVTSKYKSMGATSSFTIKKRMVFNKNKHDFGKARQQKVLRTVFYYTNKSNKTIIIKKVHTSCGCTASKASKITNKPGESGEISVAFSTRTSKGKVGKSIRVETIPTIHGLSLTIHANIVPEIYLSPDKLGNLKLKNNNPIKNFFKILSEDYPDFKIQNINHDTNCIRIKTTKYTTPDKKSSGYNIDLTILPAGIKAKTRRRNFSEQIRIRTLINNKTNDLNYHIYGSIIPNVYLLPDRIINLKLIGNNPIKKSFKILSEDHPDIKIQSISYDANCITVMTNKIMSSNQKSFGYNIDLTILPKGIRAKAKQIHFNEQIKIKASYETKTENLLFNIYGYTN